MSPLELAQAVAEHGPDAVIVHDVQGRFHWGNRRAAELFGLEQERFTDFGLSDIEPDFRLFNVQARWEAMKVGDGFTFRGRPTGAAGEPIEVEISLAVISQEPQLFLTFVRPLAQRAAAEEQVRSLLSLHRSLISRSGDALLLHDSAGRISYCDERACADLGFSQEALLAMRIQDLDLGRDCEDLWADLGDEARVVERAWRRADGSRYPVELRLNAASGPDTDLILSLARDISDRRAVEVELLRSEDWWRSLALAVPGNLARLDEKGRLQFLNRSAPAFPSGATQGQHLRELLPASAHGQARQALDSALRGRAASFEFDLAREDGHHWFRATISPLAVHDAAAGALLHAQDLTAEREGAARLREAMEEAESAAHFRSRFVSDMGHELRTPLNSIIGFGRVLAREAADRLGEEEQDHLRHLLRAAEHVSSLVDDLLDLQRLEEGRATLELEPVELAARVAEAMSMVLPQAKERGHEVKASVAGDPRVIADPRSLVQVLVNLLSNAIKFTPGEGHIEVRCGPHPDGVLIEVHDDGPGIPEEELIRIFQYFERYDTGADTSPRGSGIGLALTKALIEHMGGEVGVRSEVGEGSVFYFTLGVAPPMEVR